MNCQFLCKPLKSKTDVCCGVKQLRLCRSDAPQDFEEEKEARRAVFNDTMEKRKKSWRDDVEAVLQNQLTREEDNARVRM